MTLPRRKFSTAGAGLLLCPARLAFGTAANSAITLGIIGSGGRGAGVGGLFARHDVVRITALCDLFQDRLEEARRNLNLGAPELFRDYRDLLASAVDAVLIATPPFRHPEHFEAAVQAGKHIYLEKPVGVDVAGCRRVIAAARAARPDRNIAVGFQRRYGSLYREAERRIRQGQIGTLKFARSNWIYSGASAVKMTSPYPAEQQKLRHWAMWRDYCGDIIVEQDCHGVDVLNWFFDSLPASAAGVGGRLMRVNGDNMDHVNVTYEYPERRRAVLTATHIGARGFRKVSEEFYGLTGVIETHVDSLLHQRGPEEIETQKAAQDPTIEGVAEFVRRLQSSQPENTAVRGAESTLAAILGRTAMETARPVTWKQMMEGG
ncbi:MAG: Gfo/Idh/MocA family oxidoreductase [Acidobacteriota bacterium]